MPVRRCRDFLLGASARGWSTTTLSPAQISKHRNRANAHCPAPSLNGFGALGFDDYSTIVRLLMLTGQRANEIGALRWSEIVGDKIQLSPARTKNNRGHTVPITTAVRTI